MSKEKTQSAGVGLCGLTFIVFLILKLAEVGQVSNWSWWWVTSPLWLPLVVVLSIIAIVFLVTYLISKT